MMMKKAAITVFTSIFLFGCANNSQYFQAVDEANHRAAQIEQLRSEAEINRINALTRIAETGDETSRVAAVMGLSMGGQSLANSSSANQLVVPRQEQNIALEWARVLVPGLTTLGLGYYGYRTQSRQIDANRDITVQSYDVMRDLGSKDPLVVETPPPLIIEQPEPIIVRDTE